MYHASKNGKKNLGIDLRIPPSHASNSQYPSAFTGREMIQQNKTFVDSHETTSVSAERVGQPSPITDNRFPSSSSVESMILGRA